MDHTADEVALPILYVAFPSPSGVTSTKSPPDAAAARLNDAVLSYVPVGSAPNSRTFTRRLMRLARSLTSTDTELSVGHK